MSTFFFGFVNEIFGFATLCSFVRWSVTFFYPHFSPILAQLPPPATQACVPYPSIYIFQIKVAFKRSDIALFTSVVFRLMPCHWLSVSLFTLFESGCCVNAAFVACLLVFGRREPHHSEQASDFEDGDTSQDRGYLCLQELEERVCHHGEAKPLQHCLLTQGRSALTFTLAAISAT